MLLVVSAFATIDANNVSQGKDPIAAFGLFGYRAERVEVRPASKAAKETYGGLSEELVYLLGANAQDAILYLPYGGATARVPITAVVIESTP